MIARIWHGKTHSSKANEYMEFLEKTGLPDYLQTEGNRGVYVLRRISAEEAEFILISLWEDEDAVRNFAGADTSVACYYPGDENYLLELEPSVEHYEVMRSL